MHRKLNMPNNTSLSKLCSRIPPRIIAAVAKAIELPTHCLQPHCSAPYAEPPLEDSDNRNSQLLSRMVSPRDPDTSLGTYQ